MLTQRRVRLEQQLERQEREARTLRVAGDRLQVGGVAERPPDLQRYIPAPSAPGIPFP